MTTKLERSHSLPKNRFGQLSKNMFFARHVAQPRYLKFITGPTGQRICCVREEPLRIPVPTLGDYTKPLISDPRFNIEFSSNSYNEGLLRSYKDRIRPKRRRERFFPPVPGWNPSGTVVEDTENWRRQLARIGEMVGLVTSDELVEIDSRKETPIIPEQPQLLSVNKSPITTGQYSRQSGRWNETPKSANRSRSVHRRTPLKSVASDNLFCVDEQEREMWMLQVLCQILQTENLHEVQSWLVSSGPSEKEAVRQLIVKAIKGLEENGRIQSNGYYNENAKAIQVNMDSFGSLLANRFPNVSSSIPTTPLTETSSKPISRARTAPQMRVQVQLKTEMNSKSAGVCQTNLQSIDEKIETASLHKKPNVTQPTKCDIQRDIQILILDDHDDENKSQQATNTENGPLTFSIIEMKN